MGVCAGSSLIYNDFVECIVISCKQYVQWILSSRLYIFYTNIGRINLLGL